MDSFSSYMLRQAYKRVQRLGDRLARVDGLIDWEAFRPMVSGMFRNDTDRGGTPNARAHDVQDGSIIYKKWVSIGSLFFPS